MKSKEGKVRRMVISRRMGEVVLRGHKGGFLGFGNIWFLDQGRSYIILLLCNC